VKRKDGKHPSHYDAALRGRVAVLYMEGFSDYAIAAIIGRSPARVRQLRNDAGMPARSRGEANRMASAAHRDIVFQDADRAISERRQPDDFDSEEDEDDRDEEEAPHPFLDE